MHVTISEAQIEKIIKGIDGAAAVTTLLENDMGTQKDISSANALCVVNGLLDSVKEMIETAAEEKDGAAGGNV